MKETNFINAPVTPTSTVLPPEARDPDWTERAEQLREEEWQMAQKLFRTARTLLNRLLSAKHVAATPAEAARLLDVASKLGRLSSGLAAAHRERSGSAGARTYIDIETALERVYGGAADSASVSDAAGSASGAQLLTLNPQSSEQPSNTP